MSKIFYDHLILIEEIIPQLEPLDSESRDELIGIIDATFHHQILDLILTHLPKIHHEDFLTRFHSTPHDEALLDYLEARIDKNIKTDKAFILKNYSAVTNLAVKRMIASFAQQSSALSENEKQKLK